MIVDTSAVVAVVTGEADAELYLTALQTQRSIMSTATFLETAIVLDRRSNRALGRVFDQLVVTADVKLAPVTEAQAKIARQAYRDFGKGSGHKAQLNFGDCFAYALATDTGEPLLFKGDDFGHTGVRRAL